MRDMELADIKLAYAKLEAENKIIKEKLNKER